MVRRGQPEKVVAALELPYNKGMVIAALAFAAVETQSQDYVSFEWRQVRAQQTISAPDRDSMRFLLEIYVKDSKQAYIVKPNDDGSYALVAEYLPVSKMSGVRRMDKFDPNTPHVAKSKIAEWLADHPITIRSLGDLVDVRLEQQPFEQVIFMLASSMKQEYSVAMGVTGNVTLVLNRLPWPTVIRSAMMQVDAYCIEVDGVTHYVSAGGNRALAGKILKAEPIAYH